MSEAVVKELAFYYPNPMWGNGDWVKNLILFFDGIALLVPAYMRDRPEQLDPAIVAGLNQHGLLRIIEPETAVDIEATQKLAMALTDVITSGVLDDLSKEGTAFHELSMSRLGYLGDRELAQMIFEELKARGLAEESRDGVSIPMHPMVRSLVLVLLSQILRPYGAKIGAELSPATDRRTLVQALADILAIQTVPSPGSVIEFDLNVVSVDLGSIPIDEVLDFRAQNLTAHRRYSLSVKKFALELSRMPDEDRKVAFELRKAELDELASNLRGRAQKAWKKPSSFALSLAGAALTWATSPLKAVLSAASSLAGFENPKGPDLGAYSYLFRASSRYGY
jgi:hypothetical protein